jgi:hypothetical protein
VLEAVRVILLLGLLAALLRKADRSGRWKPIQSLVWAKTALAPASVRALGVIACGAIIGPLVGAPAVSAVNSVDRTAITLAFSASVLRSERLVPARCGRRGASPVPRPTTRRRAVDILRCSRLALAHLGPVVLDQELADGRRGVPHSGHLLELGDAPALPHMVRKLMPFCLAILASDVCSVTRCIFLVVRSVKRSHHDPRRQNTAPLIPCLSTLTLNVDWSVITMGNLSVCRNGVNQRVKRVRHNMRLCGATCSNVLQLLL